MSALSGACRYDACEVKSSRVPAQSMMVEIDGGRTKTHIGVGGVLGWGSFVNAVGGPIGGMIKETI